MPDNVVLNAGTGGETLATDANASTEHYQLVKIVTGALGTFNLVSTANPMPVIHTTNNLAQVNVVTSSGAYVPVSTSAGLLVNTSTATIATRILSTASGWGATPVVTSTSVVLSTIGIPTVVVTTSTGWGSAQTVTSTSVVMSTGSGWGAAQTVTSTAVTLSSGSQARVWVSPVVSTSGLVSYTNWTTGGSSTAPGSYANLTTREAHLQGWAVYNSTARIRSIKIYASTAPTVGSTTNVLFSVTIPGSTGGGGSNINLGPIGVYSSLGISGVVTANANATDTGTAGANDVAWNLFYNV